MKKEACLSIVEDESRGKVLMILHKRGINEGFVNFPGGKKEIGETMLECVVRETEEETGIKLFNPVEVGYIEFPTKEFAVTIFRSTEFTGELKSSEGEADAFWQDKNEMPYDKMRAADVDFVPLVLAGKKVRRQYFYDDKFMIEKIATRTEQNAAKIARDRAAHVRYAVF